MIIKKPIITEKSMSKTQEGKYIFLVDQKSNKNQIMELIKNYYKVDPIKVNIIRIKGEGKLFKNRYKTKTKDFKKAIVTIKKGQKIEGFEVKE